MPAHCFCHISGTCARTNAILACNNWYKPSLCKHTKLNGCHTLLCTFTHKCALCHGRIPHIPHLHCTNTSFSGGLGTPWVSKMAPSWCIFAHLAAPGATVQANYHKSTNFSAQFIAIPLNVLEQRPIMGEYRQKGRYRRFTGTHSTLPIWLWQNSTYYFQTCKKGSFLAK